MKTFFNRYAIYVIPALMLFFFARNLIYTQTQHMDAWMGGAMRMFTSVDKMLYRVAGFKTEIDSQEYFVNLRHIPQLKTEDASLRVKPTQELMRKVATSLETKSWCLDTVSRKVVLCDAALTASPIRNFKVKQILVYKTAFDANNKKISLTEITRYPLRDER
jgi:hypothetical protein